MPSATTVADHEGTRTAHDEKATHPGMTDARRAVLARLPVAERRLSLAGVSTAVLEGGDGQPVVLLHGPGEFAATWMRVIPDLVSSHRVIAPDLPGHGASETGEGGLDRALTWLGELIDRTCATPPTVVGHLLGGAMAARFAVGNGDRIGRLVLVDSFGLARLRPAPRFALAMMRFLARPSARTQDGLFRQCFVDLDGLREQMDGRMELLEAYALERALSPELKAALRRLMRHFGLPAIPKHDLAGITVPTSLIWGRHDRQVRVGVAERASARYGWPLHVIEDAADDPAVEQPEAFLEVLQAVLRRS